MKPGRDVTSDPLLPALDPGYARPMTRRETDALWTLVRAERAALLSDLQGLTDEQWRSPSLCGEWDVENVVAHLTAAATTTRFGWLRSMAAARFRPAMHNERRLAEHLGATPQQTLEAFRAVIDARIAPTSDITAFLGEVVVHAQDIREPLGLTTTPSAEALTAVAEFYAAKDFAVPSHAMVEGLRLRASDTPFTHGTGPEVVGPLLSLVMAMAVRPSHLDRLDGAGAATLRQRVEDE